MCSALLNLEHRTRGGDAGRDFAGAAWLKMSAWCRYEKSLGTMLVPPLEQEHKLGPLVPCQVTAQGTNWRQSSTDIAVAGLGWFAVGVSGEAEFNVWTHEGACLLPAPLVPLRFLKEN